MSPLEKFLHKLQTDPASVTAADWPRAGVVVGSPEVYVEPRPGVRPARGADITDEEIEWLLNGD